MTKSWVLIALFFQLIILIFIYRLFKNDSADTKRRKIDGAQMDSARTRELTNFALRQIEAKEINWSKILRKQTPPKDEMHDKWIVLTTINAPTTDVKKLAGIDGWKVVVVGDTKTPADWSHPNCVFLSVEKQKSLGYRIHELLPYKSYARKNIGYLYAIQHGAKIIYETDDDNSPTSGQITFFQSELGDFNVYKTESIVVNPYEHFGQSTIWPRGYPLEHIADPPSHKFVKCQGVDTSIQQGVVNGDPDVDAVFRLTRKDKGVDLKVEFDADAPPVVLPPYTMAPFNSQNTLFLNKALWGMLIPITVAFRVCDIWRGYWAQRLLWDVGSQLSFFPPNAVQFRNAHNYLEDFIDEKMLYHDAGRFVEFLVKWKSDKKDFFSRVLDLSIAMVREGFWEMKDVMLTKAWLEDLVSVGYQMPAVSPAPKSCKKTIGEETELRTKEKPSSYLRAGSRLQNLEL
ncbi:probable glycosyltransferase STELLO1 [Stylophora pistillata]|nr:probable glycosyltransferase STELLO1 [Stylophora pistillata]